MFTPQLHLPEQEIISSDYQGIMPDEVEIQKWLNSRDYMDREALLDTLSQLNRVQCEPSTRMSILTMLDSEIQKELQRLNKETALIAFPPKKEQQLLMDNLQKLLLETSMAHQIIINDIIADKTERNIFVNSLLPKSLFMAIFYLSQLLVERFGFYLSEPPLFWQTLNHLYLLAEQMGFENNKHKSHIAIKHKYLQIVVLKLLNPYRLMRQEARKIYRILETWVDYCDINSLTQAAESNAFVVNLLADESAHYCKTTSESKKKIGKSATKLERRVISIEKLRVHLGNYLAESAGRQKSNVSSYQYRMQIEMLHRVNNDMKFPEDRLEERMVAKNNVNMVSDLRACHYFISEKKPFTPQDEVNIYLDKIQQPGVAHHIKKDQSTDATEGNLINLLEEEKLFNKKNPLGEMIFTGSYNSEREVMANELNQRQLNQSLKEELWKQRNESSRGMLLVNTNDTEMPIAVGMLVAYRLDTEKSYSLAIVKWMRVNPHKGMAIGMELFTVESRAIAVKGKDGVGAGGQFQRAFLVNGSDTSGKKGKMNLILPVGVYDLGSVLNVWHNKKLNYVRIEKIVMSTDSFERVTFKVVNLES